jgi:hypothetical protein
MGNLLQKIGFEVTAGLALLAGCASPDLNLLPVSGNVSVTRVNRYNLRPGFNPSKGGTRSSVGLDLGEQVSVYGGVMMDDGGETDEVDLGAAYKIPVSDWVTLRAGVEHQRYLGKGYAHLLVAGVNMNLPLEVNVDFEGVHLVGENSKEEANVLNLRASRKVDLGEYLSYEVSVTPSVKITYLDNLRRNKGISRVVPGVSLDVKKGPWSVGVGVMQQFGDLQVDGVEDTTLFEVKLKYEF